MTTRYPRMKAAERNHRLKIGRRLDYPHLNHPYTVKEVCAGFRDVWESMGVPKWETKHRDEFIERLRADATFAAKFPEADVTSWDDADITDLARTAIVQHYNAVLNGVRMEKEWEDQKRWLEWERRRKGELEPKDVSTPPPENPQQTLVWPGTSNMMKAPQLYRNRLDPDHEVHSEETEGQVSPTGSQIYEAIKSLVLSGKLQGLIESERPNWKISPEALGAGLERFGEDRRQNITKR